MGTSGHNTWGSRGGAPALFLPISREKWGPPPGRRGNGALRPKAGKGPAHPKGTQYHPSSTRDWKTTPALWYDGINSVVTMERRALPCWALLIGDIVGSVYEWHNHKSKDFPLFQPDCRMTDDSVMTAAVASAVLMGTEDFARFQANVVAEMRRLGQRTPAGLRPPGLRLGWPTRIPSPTAAWGNGSAMRVSPVAWAAESLSQCLAWPRPRQKVTHNHPDGIAGACVVAGAVYLARVGESKAAIADHVTRYYPLDFTWMRSGKTTPLTSPAPAASPSHGGLPGGRGLWKDALRGRRLHRRGQRHHRLHGRGGGRRLYGIPGTSGTRPWPTWTGRSTTIYDQFSRQY